MEKDETSAEHALSTRPRVMISFGSDDLTLAEDIFSYLDKQVDASGRHKYHPGLDKISLTGLDFMSSIIQSFEQADVTILLVSASSIRSPWVQFELNIALNQSLTKDHPIESGSLQEFSGGLSEKIRIVPVLVSPVQEMPKQFWIFEYLRPVDFTAADQGDYPYAELADQIDQIFGIFDHGLRQQIDVRKRFDLSTNYQRLYEQIGQVLRDIVSEQTREFDEKLTSINRAFEASSSLLSPAHITIKETTAIEEIWVVSRDLYNDLRVKEFQESIRQNYLRGLDYVYFIEDVERFELLEAQYKKMYGKLKDEEGKSIDNEENFKFIRLSPGTVMPFDEVVIFDPEAGRGTSAYVQLSFDQHPNEQSVYIDLPKSTSEAMVSKLASVKEKVEERQRRELSRKSKKAE